MASIFLPNFNGTGRVSRFDSATGALLNSEFITLVNKPLGILLSGSTLFIARENGSPAGNGIVIGTWNSSTGAVIDRALIGNIPGTFKDFKVSGTTLFVEVMLGGQLIVNSYTAASGAVITAPLVTNTILGECGGMAVG